MNQQTKQDRLTPGQLLRRARNAKQWSIEEISQRLKLSESIIKKIESDQCDLSRDIYQRGYALNYAKLLGLDLEHFQITLGEKSEAPIPMPAALTRTQPAHPAEGLMRIMTYALATVVVAVPLVWSLTQGAASFFGPNADRVEQDVPPGDSVAGSAATTNGAGTNGPSHLSASVAPLTSIKSRNNSTLPLQSPLESLPAGDLSQSTLPQSELSASDEAQGEVGTETPTAAANDAAQADPQAQSINPAVELLVGEEAAALDETSQAAASAATPSAIPALRLKLQSDSWVEITDSTGKRLEYDLLRGGSVNDYAGQAPYRILIGRATGVVLEHQGETVDLAPYIRGNVASFELSRSDTDTQG